MSAELRSCGDLWTETAAPCVDALEVENPEELIKDVPQRLSLIASEEEKVFQHLQRAIS